MCRTTHQQPRAWGLAEIKPQAVAAGGGPLAGNRLPREGWCIRERAAHGTLLLSFSGPSCNQLGEGWQTKPQGKPLPSIARDEKFPVFNLNKFIDHTTNLILEEVLREGKQKGRRGVQSRFSPQAHLLTGRLGLTCR